MSRPTRSLYVPKDVIQYPRHLDAPLTTNKGEFFKEFPNRFQWLGGDWDPGELITDHSGLVGRKPIFRALEDSVLGRAQVLFAKSDGPLNDAIKAAAESITIQAQAIYGDLGIDHECSPDSLAQKLSGNKQLIAAWRGKLVVCQIHSEIAHLSSQKLAEFEIPTLPGMKFRRSLVRVPVHGDKHVIIEYTWLLNVLDKIEAKFHSLSYTLLVHDIPPFKGTPFLDLTLALYDRLDQVYDRLGCQACLVYKILESLASGAVLEVLGDENSDRGFLERVLDDIRSDNLPLWVEAQAIATMLKEFLKETGEAGVFAVMEQFGQEKLHWYPIGSEEEGMIKMYNYGTEVRETSFEFCREVRGVLFKRLLSSFYTKEGCLIPIEEDLFLDPRIIDIYSTGVCPSLQELCKIPNSAWAQVVPSKTFEFNYRPDPLSLMDDKACGVDRDQMAQYYAEVVQQEFNLHPPHDHQETRLIKWILDQPIIDIEGLFVTCRDIGGLPFAEKIIATLGKELENRYGLRMYSVLHPHVRLRASTLEKNIGDSIFPYVQEQTMTYSGAELLKRIDRLSASMADPNRTVIAIHMDLKAWNHFQYESSTFPVQSLLNQLFGVTWWDQLMWPFQQSVFISSEAYNPPHIHNRCNCWEGYNGGNQGICQRCWTLCTQMIIHLTMESFTSKYELTGQGDNQVLLVDITDELSGPTFIELIRESLAKNFQRFGLELKLEETWHSSSLLVYQRKYYYKGIPLLGGLKQTAKFAAGVKDGVYSIDAHCQTAMGSGMTLSGTVKHPFVGPFLAYLEMLSGLLANPDWRPLIQTTHKAMVLLTWVGAELGFYSVLQLPSFMYSGNKDPLSDSLAILSKIFEKYPEYRQLIGRALNVSFTDVTDDRLLDFVMNPLSPNLQRSATVDGRLQRLTEDSLLTPGHVKNKTISELFKVSQRQDRIALAKQLCSIRPLNMSLVHSMYESSHVGQAHSSLTKVSKIKSLIKLAEQQDPSIAVKGLAMTTLAIDQRYAAEVTKRLNTAVPLEKSFVEQAVRKFKIPFASWCEKVGWDPHCTFSVRVFYIVHSWRLGPLVPRGPYIPSVVEQVAVKREISHREEGHAVVITPAHDILPSKDQLETTRGPFSLYVGSKTPDPTRTIKLVNLEGLDLAGLIKSLTAMYSWVTFKGRDPEILGALCAEIELRVPGLATHLADAGSFIIGGTMEHRFYTRGTDMGAWALGRSMISTWYRMSTDRAYLFQDSDSNRLIFFQGILQHVVATLRVIPVQKSSIYAVVNLDHCSYPVDESDYTCHLSIKKPPASVIKVFRTAPRTLDSVAEELLSKKKIKELNLMSPQTDVEGLSAALASQMAKIIQRYQLGRLGGGTTDITQGAVRSPINITLIRKVPLITLLQSLVVALALHRCLGPSSGRNKCLRRLEILTSNTTGLQDVEAFRQILDSLLTAGKMLELVKLVGHPPAWSVQQLSARGVLFFLQGLEEASRSIGNSGALIPLVIEIKRTDASVNGLHHFLRSWSPSYRSHTQMSDDIDPLTYLATRGGISPPLKVFVVPEVDVLIGQSRYLDASWEAPTPQETLKPIAWPRIAGSSGGAPIPTGLLDEIHPITPPLGNDRRNIAFSGTGIAPEEVIDLTQLVKWASPSSGARYKFAEALALLDPYAPEIKSGICLAEGAGSLASLLLHMCPEMELIFNTLVVSQSMSKSIGVGYWPPALLCPCSVNDRVVNIPYISKFSGDLSVEGTWDELNTLVNVLPSGLDILTWDMEGYTDQYSTAISNLWANISKWNPRICVIKLFMCDGAATLPTTTDKLQQMGYYVHVVKPTTSNILNQEVLVVGHTLVPIRSDLSFNLVVLWETSTMQVFKDQGIRSWAAKIRSASDWVRTVEPCSYSPPFLATARSDHNKDLHLSLISIAQMLVEWVLSYYDSGDQRERGFQHLLGSRSRGSQLAWFDYYSTLVVLSTLIKESYDRQLSSVLTWELGQAWDWVIKLAPNFAEMASSAPDHFHRSLLLQKAGQALSFWSPEQAMLCQVALGLVAHLIDLSGSDHAKTVMSTGLDEEIITRAKKEYRDGCPVDDPKWVSLEDWERLYGALITFQRRLGYVHSEIISPDPWLRVTAEVFLGHNLNSDPESPKLLVSLLLPDQPVGEWLSTTTDVLLISTTGGFRKLRAPRVHGAKVMTHSGQFGSAVLYSRI